MDSLIGTIVANRFQVLRLLGRGGMGKVYEVEHTQLKKRFAIKVLAKQLAGEEDALRRFQREAEIVASLKHPNIIEIVDWDTVDDGRPLYVMELLEGMDLEERIKLHGALPWKDVASIAAQSVSALLEAHGKGILHRDLKPTNVFLTEHRSSLQVKLIDFGLARARDLAAITLYTSPKLIGTPAYMSPEQLEGKSVVGEEADCWGMAAVLYEAATAKQAFKGGYAELFYLIGKKRPIPVGALRADTPPAFADAIAAALTPAAEQRIISLEELGERIANSLSDEGGGASKTSQRARGKTRDEYQSSRAPDTLPWGATVEDERPAGLAAGEQERVDSRVAQETRKSEEEDLASLQSTIPWGSSGDSSSSETTSSSNEDLALRARSSQRMTKPGRAQGMAEGPSDLRSTPESHAPSTALGQEEQLRSEASGGDSRSRSIDNQRHSAAEGPQGSEHSRAREPQGSEHSRAREPQPHNPIRGYGLQFAMVAGAGLLALVLLAILDDSPKSSSNATQSSESSTPKSTPVTKAGTKEAGEPAPRPPALAKNEKAPDEASDEATDEATGGEASLGTLNMSANPSNATLKVFEEISNKSVFKGPAPTSLRLPVGEYRVLTERRGYLSNMTIVEVSAQQVVDNKVVLIARPKKRPPRGEATPKEPARRRGNLEDPFMEPSMFDSR